MKQSYKTALLWVFLIVMFVALWKVFDQKSTPVKSLNWSQFMAKVEAGEVKDVSVKELDYTGHLRDGSEFTTTGPLDAAAVVSTKLLAKDVTVRYEKPEQASFWVQAAFQWLPLVFIFLLFFFFMRQLQSGGGKAMSFGKSRAKLMTEHHNKVTFADVAGIDESKDELEEIISFLKDPKKFTRLGGRIPKGVLLMGPPGTGKTLLARAVAGEAGVPFFSISGSDFVEMFVGVGASRVRDLFEQGKKNAPCIIFIDEIDAVGRHRGAGLGGGHDEREQTLNQLLVEMDGFESNEGVILMAATNRPDVLDPALLRPGRFDRRIVVPRPDLNGRLGILKVHTKKVPLDGTVDLLTLARGTPGFSGADIENLVNEAALYAARRNQEKVTGPDFEFAKDKVMMGSERRSMVISEREKMTTAVHEAGHALVARILPGTDPVHKVTIIPRGRALGLTQQLPKEDRLNINQEFALNQIAILMGGRIAEELTFDQKTTGAGNDIEVATEPGPQHGLRVGHERDGAAGLRQEGGRGLPRPRDVAGAGLLRGDGPRHRRRGPPHRHGAVRPGPDRARGAPRHAPEDRRRADRVRDHRHRRHRRADVGRHAHPHAPGEAHGHHPGGGAAQAGAGGAPVPGVPAPGKA